MATCRDRSIHLLDDHSHLEVDRVKAAMYFFVLVDTDPRRQGNRRGKKEALPFKTLSAKLE